MEHELISAAELKNLPLEDDLAFVEAEAICPRSVAEAVKQDDSERGDYADEMKLQYITVISALADQFNVPNLSFPNLAGNYDNKIYLAYPDYVRQAMTEVAKIHVRSRRGSDALSVQLASKTRARIEQELENLRRAVTESHLPASLKNNLHEKLDEFAAELRNNRRISFGKAMAILVVVAANLGSSVAGVAEAPTALANIMHWIGTDKAAEDAEVRRLGAPAKALPAPAPPAVTKAPASSGGPTWDDEIPF
jgi:hypothetical protein